MSSTSEKGEWVGELESDEQDEDAERKLWRDNVGLVRPLEVSEEEAQVSLPDFLALRKERRSWRWTSDSTNCICLPRSSNLLGGMKVMMVEGVDAMAEE